jgi:hypothetical protein
MFERAPRRRWIDAGATKTFQRDAAERPGVDRLIDDCGPAGSHSADEPEAILVRSPILMYCVALHPVSLDLHCR